MAEQSFFAELRKRKVAQAAAIYGAVAWGLTEVLVTVVDRLFLPQWVATLVVILFVVGFPIAMFLAWTFDITKEGIQRTAVASRRGKASIALSMVLLLAGTTGLFFLIEPALENRTAGNVATVSPNSIAILPFDFSGPNPDESYLGPGLSDELRDQLGRVDGLRIAARSSSVAAAREGVDAIATAVKLRVSHLVEGNVRRQGNLLRVSVQLIDGGNGLEVWSESFERGRAELLSVQQDIAQAVAKALLPDSNPQVAGPATQVATANEKMLLARHYEQQVRERQDVDPILLQRAVQLYREATELDPNSALAHARLAGALMYLGDIDGAEAPAFKALSLDPNLAEVQHTLGNLMFALGRPNMGDPYARAVELNPNLPDAIADYAYWYWYNVSTDTIFDLFQRALDLDPLNLVRYGALGRLLAIRNQGNDTHALIEQMQSLFDGATAYRAIAHLYDLLGDVDHAIAWTIKARDAEPENRLHVYKLAEYYTDIGDFETAKTLEPELGVGLLFKMRRYEEMIDEAEFRMIDFPEDMQLRVYLAFAYKATGQFDAAVRTIDRSGVLESYAHTRRGTEEVDAFNILLDAAYGSGEIERARELTEWVLETHFEWVTSYWWVSLGSACRQAILGNDDEVDRYLQSALDSNVLPWEPMLKDRHCFKRFADHPTYLAVVKHFDDRRTLLRNRLPATLASYGVAL